MYGLRLNSINRFIRVESTMEGHIADTARTTIGNYGSRRTVWLLVTEYQNSKDRSQELKT